MTPAAEKKASDAAIAHVRRELTVPLTVPDATLASGRCAVVRCLDCVLAHPTNLAKFAQAFQSAVDDDPMAFMKSIVMPLTPKDKSDDSSGPVVTAESVAQQLCAMSGLVPDPGATSIPVSVNDDAAASGLTPAEELTP